MNDVAKSRWLIVKFFGGVAPPNTSYLASAAGLRKRPESQLSGSSGSKLTRCVTFHSQVTWTR